MQHPHLEQSPTEHMIWLVFNFPLITDFQKLHSHCNSEHILHPKLQICIFDSPLKCNVVIHWYPFSMHTNIKHHQSSQSFHWYSNLLSLNTFILAKLSSTALHPPQSGDDCSYNPSEFIHKQSAMNKLNLMPSSQIIIFFAKASFSI